MKTKFFLPYLLFTCHIMFGQNINNIAKVDSSFTLTKQLQKDKTSIRQHGLFFNQNIKQILADFKTMEALSIINFSKYQEKIIQDNGHLIKIWTVKAPLEKVFSIIEINSVYGVDTLDINQKIKDTICYNDYFIQLKNTTKNVHYQTIKKQGVSEYSIGSRQVLVTREIILAGTHYINNDDKIKKLLNKYNLK